MEIVKEDVCYGCKVPKRYENECLVRRKEQSIACPCTECIVKVMCVTTCSTYEKFCREYEIWK